MQLSAGGEEKIVRVLQTIELLDEKSLSVGHFRYMPQAQQMRFEQQFLSVKRIWLPGYVRWPVL